MGTPREERNKRICERYLNDGDSAESLAIDSGLSVASVRIILREGNALRGTTKRVYKTDEEKVISPLHARIGGMVSHHRAFTRGIDRKMASEELNWSMQRVASVEKGAFNITLLDLQDIARFLGKPIEEVVSGQSKREYATGDRKDTHGVSPKAPYRPTPAHPTRDAGL